MPEQDGRTFVKFDFCKVDPLLCRLSPDERTGNRLEFSAVGDELATEMVRSFRLVGLRADADFLLWESAESIEHIQETATRLWSTRLGNYLTQPHSFLAVTRHSQYLGQHWHAGQEGEGQESRLSDAKDFISYPFLKPREWYLLPREERQQMVNDHFHVGHKYPSVKINTTYSFGLDDQEFVERFEANSPTDLVDLIMDLRGTEGSRFTLRDTPILTCIRRPLRETLESIANEVLL